MNFLWYQGFMFTFAEEDKGSKRWETGEACVTLLVRNNCIHLHCAHYHPPPFTLAICLHLSKQMHETVFLNVNSDMKVLLVQVQCSLSRKVLKPMSKHSLVQQP